MTSPTISASARRLAAATLVLVASGLVACGDDDDTDATADTTSSTAAVASDDGYGSPGGTADTASDAGSTVVAKGFELTSPTVTAGSEVTFDNQDRTAHTLTADDGDFDSGPVAAGETATVTAPGEPGTYGFHCEIHPSMTGSLTVEA